MNVICIEGNLVRDSEIKFPSEDGTRSFHHFTLAVNKSKKVHGKWCNEASYFDCQYYAKITMSDRLKKGSLVSVDGSMIQQRWKDKDTGANRYKWILDSYHVEVHLNKSNYNGDKPNNDPNADPTSAAQYNNAPDPSEYQSPDRFESDPNMPF